MANQIIIDIGAVANDGTGDPLRTAFNYVNNNFSNIWATGVANSNVAFSGNKILTTNTNGNLVLAPNGTGKVQANVDIVPNANNTLSLGSLSNKWNTVYTQFLEIGGALTTNDLTVDGNLTVTGNIIQIGNLVTDAKTIQLSNTASTANAANGSGITVGANDNIATMLYNSSSNVWTTNIGITVTGNVSGTYFIGNGSQLTGVTSYANANAVAYGQAGWAGNIIPSGNAVYSLGNATNQWSDLYVSNATIYMNNVPVSLGAGNVLTVGGQAVLSNDSNTSISTTGNITADQFIGNSVAFGTSGLNLGDDNYIVYEGLVPSGIRPSNPDLYNLGNVGYAWQEVHANIYYGDGSQLTGISSNQILNGTSDVAIPITDGNIEMHADAANWVFDTTGKLTAPGEVYGQFYTIRGGNGPGTDIGSLGYAGNIVDVYGVEGVRISTIDESGPFWQFDITGNLAIPGTIVSDSTILFDNRESGNTADIQLYAADDILLQARDRGLGSDAEGGDINIYAGDGAPDDAGGGTSNGGDIQIIGGYGGTGNISSGAGGGFVRLDAGNGGDGSATARAGDGGTAYLSAGSGGIENGGGGGAGGDVVITAGDTTAVAQDRGSIILNAGGGGDASTIGGYVRVHIPSVGVNPGGDWTFTGSGLTLEPPPNAEIFNPSLGNLTVGTVGNTIVRNIGGVTTYDWVFDPTGNLNLPTNGSINFNAGGITQATDEDFVITVNDADNDGFAIFNRVTDADGNVVGQTELRRDRLNINLDMLGSNYQWQFSDNQGIMYLPGNISGNYGSDTSFFVTDNGSGGTMEMKTISYIGDTLGSNVRVTQSNATISTSNAAYTWTFDNTGNLTVPGNTIVSTANATGGLGGKSVSITAGASDAVTWNSNPGGNVNITGGYGSFGDGGGGPGGQVNIIGGGSSDSHAGNVSVNSGSNTWTFDYTGNLTAPGNISTTGNVIANIVVATTNGSGTNFKVGDDMWLGDVNVSDTMSLRGQQNAANAYLLFGNADTTSTLGRSGSGPLTWTGNFSVTGNISGNTAGYAIGYRDIPQVSFTGNATIATTDAGKHYYSTQSSNYILTIANNASQGFQVGAAITIVNQGTGNITVAQGSGVELYMAGNATSGNRSVATFGMATLIKVATDTWFINGTGVS